MNIRKPRKNSLPKEGVIMSQIIKDEDKLDFEFVPEELPHRAKELEKLDEMHSRILDSKLARHSLITGQSGYGKTVLSKYFFQNLREDGLQKGINVELVFVNCKSSHTPTMLMSKVMKDLRMSVGKDQETMNEALKTWLIKNDSRLCVVIRVSFML